MEYTVTQLPQSRVQIDIEVPSEELDQYRQQTIQKLSKNLQVEGFRPGNVPAEIAQQQLGEEQIMSEAARAAIEATYLEVVEKEKLDVIGEPEVSIKKLAPGNPFSFQLTVAQIPDVSLPEYQELAKQVQRKEVAVEEKDIEDALQWLRENRKQEGQEEVPELTDEFAQSLGAFQNVAELRESIADGLRQEKENQESQRVRQEILEQIAQKAEVEIPEVLIDQEQKNMMEQTKQSVAQMMQVEFDEYLQKIQKTEEEFMESLREDAEKRVKNSLVLRKITTAEDVQATEEEVEQETQRMLQQYEQVDESQRPEPERVRQYVRGAVENEKTLRFLEGFAQPATTS